MKKNAMRKVSVITVMSAMVMANTAMSFAASDNPQTVPAHINVPVTAIDFTITEKINMTGTADSHDLTVDSLAVTNNNEIGVLNIDSIAATAARTIRMKRWSSAGKRLAQRSCAPTGTVPLPL